MDVSDIRTAPYHILRAQVVRNLAETKGENGAKLVALLAEAGFGIQKLVADTEAVNERLRAQRAEQWAHAARLAGATKEVSATVDEGARLIRKFARRVANLDGPLPMGLERLRSELEGHGLPASGASFATVLDHLDRIVQWAEAFPEVEVEGLTAADRCRAAELRDELLASVAVEEEQETGLEHATNGVRAAKAELVDLCVRYWRMHQQINADRADEGLPPIPGGNFEVIKHWAATRPSAMAAAKAAAAAASAPSAPSTPPVPDAPSGSTIG